MTQVDHESVQVTAAKVIFDLLHLYGLEAFRAQQQQQQQQGKDDDEEEEESGDGSESVTSSQPMPEENDEGEDEGNIDKAIQRILNLLTEFLDKEVNQSCTTSSIHMYNMLNDLCSSFSYLFFVLLPRPPVPSSLLSFFHLSPSPSRVLH